MSYTVAITYIWLSSPCNMAGVTEESHFKFHFILFNLQAMQFGCIPWKTFFKEFFVLFCFIYPFPLAFKSNLLWQLPYRQFGFIEVTQGHWTESSICQAKYLLTALWAAKTAVDSENYKEHKEEHSGMNIFSHKCHSRTSTLLKPQSGV